MAQQWFDNNRIAAISDGVEAAEDFGTYVAVHTYNPTCIQRALEAGVKTIEHGNLADEETMQMMVDKGAFWIPQIWADEVFVKQGLQKAKKVTVGTETSMKLEKKTRCQNRIRHRLDVRSREPQERAAEA